MKIVSIYLQNNFNSLQPFETKNFAHIERGDGKIDPICLIGANGAGKSTLLKLMLGEIMPIEGQVRKHMHVTFARYNQHSNDVLDESKTPLEFVPTVFPDKKLEEQDK